MQVVQLAQTLQDEDPGVPQRVSVLHGDVDEQLDALDVLLLYVPAHSPLLLTSDSSGS